ncbi:pseudouridine synthase [Virgibacillus sp. YIM 98842]|uniref:pseudouridine synthase n=1 Tax=Virgibacillus sp. YIM 98842 TaxID=2663533 RepID=UPI0013DCD004|nr:pseudouridine synthase [Virgibacillus sp. YIM 98842]
MRLDKLVSNAGYGSRKDVKTMLKKKRITVNNKIIRDGSFQVDPAADVVKLDEKIIHYEKYIYLMLHKPPGVVSATADAKDETVIDLLDTAEKHFDPFCVGRLDKDTEGLLLLTNDGELAHELTSPKKEIEKTYFAKINGTVTETDIDCFKKGVVLDDGYQTKPAGLRILKSGEDSEVEITITEGKFHQIKRMFQAVGKKVVYLKRLSMGGITLDERLPIGTYRRLTEEEQSSLETLKK